MNIYRRGRSAIALAFLLFVSFHASAQFPPTCFPAGSAQCRAGAVAFESFQLDIVLPSIFNGRDFTNDEGEAEAAMRRLFTPPPGTYCDFEISLKQDWRIATPAEILARLGIPKDQFALGVDFISIKTYRHRVATIQVGQCVQSFDGELHIYRHRVPDCGAGYAPSASNTFCERKGLDKGKMMCCTDAAQTNAGNPINAGIGNKYQVETDYVGHGPFPLRFARTYNSGGPQIFAINPSGFTPSLGAKWSFWRHSYQRTLEKVASTSIVTVRAFRHDGRVLAWNLFNGQYVSEGDVTDVLQATTSGATQTGWSYRNADDETEIYDLSGKLLSITNRAGLTQTLAYSDATTPPEVAPWPGLLISVGDPFGRQLHITYDSQARLVSMTDPAGGLYRFGSTADGVISSVIYPDGASRIYHYENTKFTKALTGITDEKGVRFATWTYDQDGRATSSVHAGGAERFQLQYGAASTTIIDPFLVARPFAMTNVLGVAKNSAITGLPCPSCGPAARTYDAQGNVATSKDWNGNRTDYTYEPGRNLETRRVEGLTSTGTSTIDTRAFTTQWHPTFRLPAKTAHPQVITTYVYNGDGGVTCGTRPDGVTLVPGVLCSKSAQSTGDMRGNDGFGGFGALFIGVPRVWNYSYDSNGQPLTVDGPRADVSDVITYTYYANDDPDLGKRGNIATAANALGQLTSFTSYNPHGQATTIVDSNGATTTLTYDARQRLVSRTIAGETMAYEYDAAGLLTRITRPDGSFLSYGYDDAHRLTSLTDSDGSRIVYSLDELGNRTKEETFGPANQLVQARSRVYDSQNRLLTEIGAQGQTTQYDYDPQGNVIRINDPLNHATLQSYDSLNRLLVLTDANLGQTRYDRDGVGRPTMLTDPRGLVTNYSYDGFGNLKFQFSPDTGGTERAFDAAGNLLTQLDAKGQLTTYAYDALNRVTLITFQDGSTQTYGYDQGTNAVGRLSSIREANADGVVTSELLYTYDARGRTTSEARSISGVQYLVRYTYDVSGRLAGLTYPSGRSVAYGFDSVGRVNLVSTSKDAASAILAQNVAYQPFGPVSGYFLGNGQSYQRGFDLDGRILSYTLGTQAFALGYDPAGRITFISDVANPANSNTYDYDNLDRLTQAVVPGTPYAYTYDAVGNRLSKTTGAATETYSYSATSNRISSITSASGSIRNFVFDDNGSTTADGQNSYVYDVRGRMVAATSSIGTTTYQVNALGQRQSKTVPGKAGSKPLFADTFPGPDGRPIDDQADGLWKGGGKKTVAIVKSGQAVVAAEKHIDSAAVFPLGPKGLVLTAKIVQGTLSIFNAKREEGVTISYVDRDVAVKLGDDDESDMEDERGDMKDERTGTRRFRLAARGAVLQAQIDLKPGFARVRISSGKESFDTGDLPLPRIRQGDSFRLRLGGAHARKRAIAGIFDDIALAIPDGGAVAPQTVHFVYDMAGKLIGEYRDQGSPIREYLWLGEVPIAVAANGAMFFAHADHLNTPRAIFDSNQQTRWSWDQGEPFGDSLPNEEASRLGAFEFPMRVSVGYADNETGGVYSYFRDYAPQFGRFRQFDPIGLRGGLNGFAYVASDPLTRIDPYGLAPSDSDGFATRYGNWCGRNWSGGQAGRQIPTNPAGPIDSVDECCMNHDYCYATYECDKCMPEKDAKTGKERCDEALVSCLDQLKGKAPLNWPKPPRAGTETEAYFFCQKAKKFFMIKLGK